MKVRQERDLLPVRWVLGLTAFGVFATAFGVLLAALLGSCRARQLGGELVLHEDELPVPDEVNAMEMMRFEERAGLTPPPPSLARQELDRWSWANRADRRVRVPVDAAIELYLSRRRSDEAGP